MATTFMQSVASTRTHTKKKNSIEILLRTNQNSRSTVTTGDVNSRDLVPFSLVCHVTRHLTTDVLNTASNNFNHAEHEEDFGKSLNPHPEPFKVKDG